jgi:hypothetical protein
MGAASLLCRAFRRGIRLYDDDDDVRRRSDSMTAETIRRGFDVFLHDGQHAFGAVRDVLDKEIIVYIENAGDFSVPLTQVKDVHDEKVILNGDKISNALRTAINRAHQAEDPRI